MKRTLRNLIAGTAVVVSMSFVVLGDEPAPRAEGPRPEARGDRIRRVSGEIAKIDNGTVTIISRNRSNERTIDLKLDENVKVTVESDEKVRVIGEAGDVQERRKAVAGKPSDLKVGQRVIATTTFGGVATEISASSAPQGEGERPRGDAPRDGERPRAEGAHDGEKPRGEGARDGERPRTDAPRDGEKPRANVARDGDRPRGDAPRDGERPRGDAPRDGERARGDAPRDGEPRAARPAREGERNAGGDTISGDIARVSGDQISVKTASSANAATTPGAIRVSADTQVIIEGAAAKLSDLQPGMPVNVTVRNGQASKIEVPIDLSKPKK